MTITKVWHSLESIIGLSCSSRVSFNSAQLGHHFFSSLTVGQHNIMSRPLPLKAGSLGPLAISSRLLDGLSPFLAPALIGLQLPSIGAPPGVKFSTTRPRHLPRDRSRSRGVSALRRTGPRQPLSVSKDPLPRPVLDPSRRSKVQVDENHGLWQFFDQERTALNTPEQDNAHGTHWHEIESLLCNGSFVDQTTFRPLLVSARTPI